MLETVIKSAEKLKDSYVGIASERDMAGLDKILFELNLLKGNPLKKVTKGSTKK